MAEQPDLVFYQMATGINLLHPDKRLIPTATIGLNCDGHLKQHIRCGENPLEVISRIVTIACGVPDTPFKFSVTGDMHQIKTTVIFGSNQDQSHQVIVTRVGTDLIATLIEALLAGFNELHKDAKKTH